MAVLGLRFCARAFSSCGKWGPLFITVRGPLIITAPLVAEHRLQTRRLSNCGSRDQLLRGMWDLPRPGLEPVSPALAGRFSTTVPPGKPPVNFYLKWFGYFFYLVFEQYSYEALIESYNTCSRFKSREKRQKRKFWNELHSQGGGQYVPYFELLKMVKTSHYSSLTSVATWKW